MSLNSFHFIIYFTILLVLLAVLQLFRKRRETLGKIQLLFLLLFSYFFIFKSDLRFCLCIIGVTAISYFFAIRIEKANSKFWLTGGAIALVLILGYFKYANFFKKSSFLTCFEISSASALMSGGMKPSCDIRDEAGLLTCAGTKSPPIS